MIASISRGERTRGVLAYVYGPGDEDEHTDQHTVAAFTDLLPDPGRALDFHQAVTRLAKILDLRVVQAGRRAPKDHVWHCSVRAAPEDRHLTDAEWEQIARRVLDAAGIAPTGDPDGCRWVVVRHAEDHVHIVATTVRADLTQARTHRDWHRVMDELTRIEQDYGLRQVDRTSGGKRTTAKRATRAEVHKAKRQGQGETSRERLRTAVRESLAGAVSEEEFLAAVAGHGVRVKIRRLPSGDAQGYSFALPGERNAQGQPVWFPGSQLSPDLSLPKIRARLATGADQPGDTVRTARSAKPALQQAGHLAEQTLRALHHGTAGPRPGKGTLWAVSAGFGEVLDAFAYTHYGTGRNELRQAARAWGQIAHAHEQAAEGEMRALRSAARTILAGGPSLGRGTDTSAALALIDTLLLIVLTLYRRHKAQGHRQHARTARATADHLHTAATRATTPHLTVLTTHGRRLPLPVRDRLAAAVHHALPADLATRILTTPGWPALAATLSQAQAHGHDPATLLRQAAEARELDSAEDSGAVLTWRIHRDTDLPPLPATTLRQAKRTPTPTAPATTYRPPTPTAPPAPGRRR
ncbi:relaxase/mobilization nuclease domain-containing protein [Streptomyces sp. B1866]|uniref:relaxase/mobilization nuclease domain-containing protein n=1 Tax=Streptomyces sp. B1866 TaxID=3075431 RepID=UPI00288C9B24|nr:relaxase/mobilization nuclease domain-containing protein [Streptomyces sp. B1866]MDT3397730.1 relaxase/mobilization nuclease domain-containing protein [Streptomyces sp. B1866]